MVVLNVSFLDWKHPFLGKFGPTNQILSLSRDLVPKIIHKIFKATCAEMKSW